MKDSDSSVLLAAAGLVSFIIGCFPVDHPGNYFLSGIFLILAAIYLKMKD